MKNIIKFLFATLILAAAASCTEKGPDNPNGGDGFNENIKFEVKVLEVDGVAATIRVEHDGSEKDTWYGFATTESDVLKAYSKKVEELTKEGKITGLSSKNAQTIQLDDLNSKTKYLYIVFGITENGEIYGVPASAEFTTGNKKIKMEEHDGWKVTYAGAGEIQGKEYEHVVTVKSGDLNKYFITAFDKVTFETNDMFDLAQYELDYLKEFILEFNEANNANITIKDMLFTGNGTDALNVYPGDWYAVAIGVDNNGELSGLYSYTEFNIPEPEASPAYNSWLGKWTWTGSNGVAWNVEFHHGINNMMYYMSGWEGYTEDLQIQVTWDDENEIWAIYTYSLGIYGFGDDGSTPGNVYILGCIGSNLYPIEGLPICVGGFDEKGNRVCFGYAEEGENGSTISIEYMMYIAIIDNQYYGITEGIEKWPTFPIVITPYTETGTASATEAEEGYKSVMKFTKAPKIIRTYYDFCKNVITR